MTINLQTGTSYTPPPAALPGARSAEIQVPQPQDHGTQRVPDSATPVQSKPIEQAIADSEKQRYEQVRRAAQAMATNAYPVSDKTFTIYKDASGQFITRYTSLRDGKVTYVPEPKLLAMMESHPQAVVSLQA